MHVGIFLTSSGCPARVLHWYQVSKPENFSHLLGSKLQYAYRYRSLLDDDSQTRHDESTARSLYLDQGAALTEKRLKEYDVALNKEDERST